LSLLPEKAIWTVLLSFLHGKKNHPFPLSPSFSYVEQNTYRAHTLHCKKELAIFPSPAGMSLTKLSLGGKKLNYSRPGRV